MKLLRNLTLCLTVVCSLTSVSYAQRSLSYFTDNFYASEYNPSYISEDTINVFFGNSIIDVANNGFTLNQVVDGASRSTLIRLESLSNGRINNYNLAGIEATISTIDLGYRLKSGIQLSAGHSWRLQSGLGYTQDLVNLAAFGNAPYIGSTLDIGVYTDYTAFNELYLGAAKKFGKFSIGAKVKYLSGIENLSTGQNKLLLNTSNEIYQLELDADYELFNSRVLTYNGIEDVEADVESYLNFNNFLANNHGFALDLGASIDVNENLTIFLSAIDIGSITWDNSPIIYSLKDTKTLEGIDIIDIVNNEGGTINIQDTLYQFFDAESTLENYTSNLNATLFFGGKLSLNEYTFGMMMSSQNVADDNRISLSLVAKKKLNDVISLGISNSVRDGIFINPGLMIDGKYKSIRGWLTTDNVIALVAPKSQNIFNLQGGIGLAF